MTRAYYNEIDPFAAAWLRNLIAAGLVANGDVDERDIRDVRPSDLAGYTQCHFFAGIGVWSYALRLAGWPDDRPVWTGSCPCQPFSAAGRRDGFDDERHLWPHWHHLIWQRRPAVVFGEQVASKDGWPWIDLVQSDMEGTGYSFGAAVAPVAGFGAPHGRHRIWFVADTERGCEDEMQHGRSGRAALGVGQADVNRGGGASCNVAATERDRRHGRGHLGPTGRVEPANSGFVGDTDDTRLEGRSVQGRERASERAARTTSGDATGGPCSVADTNKGERGWITGGEGRKRHRAQTGWQRSYSQLERGGETGSVADTESDRWRQVGAQHGGCGEGSCTPGLDERSAYGGAVHGPWHDAEWLWCRDEKWRPIEPGTFPLVDGASARVGRLRAYGNAISPWPAAEFIAAYLEARGEDAVTLMDMLE